MSRQAILPNNVVLLETPWANIAGWKCREGAERIAVNFETLGLAIKALHKTKVTLAL